MTELKGLVLHILRLARHISLYVRTKKPNEVEDVIACRNKLRKLRHRFMQLCRQYGNSKCSLYKDGRNYFRILDVKDEPYLVKVEAGNINMVLERFKIPLRIVWVDERERRYLVTAVKSEVTEKRVYTWRDVFGWNLAPDPLHSEIPEVDGS